MQFFDSNIASLQKQNAGFTQKIKSIEDAQKFELFMDEGDYSSLNFVDKTEFIPLYESRPEDEITASVKKFEEFEAYPYLYIYGLGNGALVKQLLQNKKLQRLVVIEPEIEIAYIVLHVVDLCAELEQGRLVLFGEEDVSFANFQALFPSLQEQRYARVYDMHTNTPYYQKVYSESLLRTNQIMLESIYHAVNVAGNDTKDALIGLKHHIINMPTLLSTPTLYKLLDSLRFSEAAVLVSTGPSLTKQLPLLKEIAPYVRIIAVDASFPVLYKAGIKPDVVVSIERVPQSARFFKELPKEAFDDVVIGLSSLQHKEVIESIQGGTMQMSMRPLGYMTYTGPQQWGYIGIGQSAANMAFELIYHSKFKQCILIGQDLAYGEDGSSHADGHVFGMDNVKTKDTDIWVEGWGGEKRVLTNHIWTMFKNFFQKDVAEARDRLETINATQGGVRIEGTLELGFAEAIQKYIKRKKIKPKISLQSISNQEKILLLSEVDAKINTIVKYVEQLFEELKELFLETATLSQKIEKQEKVDKQQLELLLGKIKNIERYHEEELFDLVVWHIAQSMMLVQDIRIAPLEVYKPKNEAESLERLELLVHAYKPWLFSFCGVLDATLKTISYARARRLMDEIEVIDVYLGDEKIDSFNIQELESNVGRVFDVDMRGILYDVSDEHQEQIDAVVFRDAKSGDELPREFVDVIGRDDERYQELEFVNTLDDKKYNENFRGKYKKDAISFIAIQENLDDKDFIMYIFQLLQKFLNLKVSILYFNNVQKEQAENVFRDISEKEFILINSIEDIITNSELYIHNFMLKASSAYYEKVSQSLALKNNIFIANLTHEFKKSGDISDIELVSNTNISLNDSIVLQIFEKHKKINKFKFINSLNQHIDKEKIKEMYCKNTIGFLALEENLQDEDFMRYIEELKIRFPQITVKAFCLENILSKPLDEIGYKVVKVESINGIVSECEIYCHNHTGVSSRILTSVLQIISASYRNMYIQLYRNDLYSKKIRDVVNKESIYYKYPREFGFTTEDLQKTEGMIWALIFNSFVSKITGETYSVDPDENLHEFLLFKSNKWAFEYKEFKHLFFNLRKLSKKYQ